MPQNNNDIYPDFTLFSHVTNALHIASLATSPSNFIGAKLYCVVEMKFKIVLLITDLSIIDCHILHCKLWLLCEIMHKNIRHQL